MIAEMLEQAKQAAQRAREAAALGKEQGGLLGTGAQHHRLKSISICCGKAAMLMLP
jgi:hypothetical protein